MSDHYRVRLLDGTIAKIEDCSNNIEITEVLSYPDNYKSLYAEFQGCVNLEKIPPIPDTVVNCDSMLAGCTKFNQEIKIPERVTSVMGMLDGCVVFNKPVTLHKNVNNCSAMLRGCAAFNSKLEISESVSNYKDIIRGCKSLDTKNIICSNDDIRNSIINDIQCNTRDSEQGPGYIVRLNNGEYVEVWDIENRDDIEAVIVKPGEY